MKTLSKKEIIDNFIPSSAGYQTDAHTNNTISTKENPLPKKASKIRFRSLNNEFSFSWSNWYFIKNS